MEDFKYITNRSIFLKCMYVLGVFLFVKEATHYKIYYVLSVLMVVINALINLFYSRRFVKFSFRTVDMRPFYHAFLIMGVYVLLTNVYTSLNPVWLGFVTDTDEVGYFTTATKLHNIIMAFLLSFTSILFPRVSNLVAEGNMKEFWQKINISFDAIFLFSFPTICFLLIGGPKLLFLVVGEGFEGAFLPLRIITPLVLIIGIEQILVIQILMTMHCDNIVLRNSLIGACVAILFNILLTSTMGAVGSSVVWLITECVIMGLSIYIIHKKFAYVLPVKRFLAYCVAYVPLLAVLQFTFNHLDNDYTIICSLAILTVLYTSVTEILILKNKVALQLLTSLHL